MPAPQDEPTRSRKTLRERLIAERERFAQTDAAPAAQAALGRALLEVLAQLEPELLGVYWPMRSEFNAAPVLESDKTASKLPLALPFAHRSPPRMEYRRWDGSPPSLVDEHGIASANGDVVVPDTVLVPCVGFTREGFRLGYGGGYFDRWLALHPHVTTIGVAWSLAEIDAAAFAAEPHDQPLTLIVTERGVVG